MVSASKGAAFSPPLHLYYTPFPRKSQYGKIHKLLRPGSRIIVQIARARARPRDQPSVFSVMVVLRGNLSHSHSRTWRRADANAPSNRGVRHSHSNTSRVARFSIRMKKCFILGFPFRSFWDYYNIFCPVCQYFFEKNHSSFCTKSCACGSTFLCRMMNRRPGATYCDKIIILYNCGEGEKCPSASDGHNLVFPIGRHRLFKPLGEQFGGALRGEENAVVVGELVEHKYFRSQHSGLSFLFSVLIIAYNVRFVKGFLRFFRVERAHQRPIHSAQWWAASTATFLVLNPPIVTQRLVPLIHASAYQSPPSRVLLT